MQDVGGLDAKICTSSKEKSLTIQEWQNSK